MSELNTQPMIESLSRENEPDVEEAAISIPKKKPFVEPAISVPIDVLEATTFFFQVPVDSGSL